LFIGEDSDKVIAVGVLALDVLQGGPDRAGKIAAPDLVTGQAIALAAVERQRPPLLTADCGRAGLTAMPVSNASASMTADSSGIG